MILIIYRSQVCREIVLPNADNTDYRIFIDSKEFKLKKSFYLSLEVIAHKWSITNENGEYKIVKNQSEFEKTSLDGGDIVSIITPEKDSLRCIVVDADPVLASFEKYFIGNGLVTVGSEADNTVQCSFLNLISKHHCSLRFDGADTVLEDTSSNGTFVNHIRVGGRKVLGFGEIIDVFGLKIICFGDMIAVGSLFSKFSVSDKIEKFTLPKVSYDTAHAVSNVEMFNRSPRNFREICSETVVIEPPTVPQFSKKRSMLSVIGPSFTMAIPMVLGCGLTVFSTTLNGSGANAFMFTGIITSVGSALMGGLWAYYNIKETKKREAEDESERFNIYGNYLIEIADYIKEKYRQNFEALNTMYPSADICAEYTRNNPELWCRNFTHSDFLFCRLGTGDIDFQVDIQIPKEKFSVTYDGLKDKPAMLYDNFKKLNNVPVGIDLQSKKLWGIAGGENKTGAFEIVDDIIAQIAANISYTDVKIAFCFDEKEFEDKNRWDYVRWLPHVWSENKNTRYYATNRQECADVFFELANIMRVRCENENKDIYAQPHYILFVSDVSLLDGELISKYVFDRENNTGLTTFLITDYCRNLPNVCENIIQNDSEFCGFYNVMSRYTEACSVHFDSVSSEKMNMFAKTLSGVAVREIKGDNSIAQSLDFFEMYGVQKLDDFNIIEQWQKNRTFNTMKALVGKKAGGADCYLDIHEKYHGPHGLIAGTTGSGKSELIQTFMLSLAINFSPDDVAFFVIDFKGGGMANLFVDLPHMAGQISNLSGNQVRRAMISIKSENLRRQRIFGEYGVNNINNYTRLYKSGEAPTPIPHLVIIIDEFAELKKEEPDFMRELISVAQVGRSLGVHLILATQKPSGTVDDNIWSNAKFRLCLRVQDRQDSNDMLHKPDAAYITQAGRCYLQVGNDEIYELFQSGWSGAPYDDSNEGGKQEIATMITPTGKTAIVGSHTKMKRKEQEKLRWYLFLYRCARSISKSDEFLKEADSNQGDVINLLADKIIENARKNKFNIGNGNSDINAVKNFLKLIPKDVSDDTEAVKKIIFSASLNNIKLPEVKEKTQLEAVVEYIAKTAKSNGYSFKARLWMPLLKEEIILSDITKSKFNGWNESDSWSLNAVTGIYDDPENQAQLPLSVDFANGGHLAVCGSVVTGKSTFLQTLIYSLAVKYSPNVVNFYILDFSSGMLSSFEKLPHTGGVLRENDVEKIGKFFSMIKGIIDERKKLFNGGNYRQYVKVHGTEIPSIVIVIDNFAGFKEKTENAYEDTLIHLSREGVGYGIFLALSSAGFGMAEIQNRIGDNIRTVVSLEMGDKFKYMDVMRATHIDVIPESGIKGRGIAFVEGRLLEFQTALAIDAEDDYKRNAKIEAMSQKMRDMWDGNTAKQIPFIPENPVFDDLKNLDEYSVAVSNKRLVPFAYNYVDASVYSIDLADTYCYSISGKRRTGKTNLLKLLMFAVSQKNGKGVVIEKESNELKLLSSELGFEYIDSDKGVFDYFKSITDEFVARNKYKHTLEEDGLSDLQICEKMSVKEPMFIFISDITKFIDCVYHPEGNITNMSGYFENIIEKGSLHNIYFFACINTDNLASAAGSNLYRLFTGYKTGVHLGGNVASQRIFNFQNIHYSQMSKSSKKGHALTPSKDDDTTALKIIVPLFGSREE